MVTKEQLLRVKECFETDCDKCNKDRTTNCVAVWAEGLPQTALHLLNRLETAETILRDILQSGNVTACRKEIKAWLGRVER